MRHAHTEVLCFFNAKIEEIIPELQTSSFAKKKKKKGGFGFAVIAVHASLSAHISPRRGKAIIIPRPRSPSSPSSSPSSFPNISNWPSELNSVPFNHVPYCLNITDPSTFTHHLFALFNASLHCLSTYTMIHHSSPSLAIFYLVLFALHYLPVLLPRYR